VEGRKGKCGGPKKLCRSDAEEDASSENKIFRLFLRVNLGEKDSAWQERGSGKGAIQESGSIYYFKKTRNDGPGSRSGIKSMGYFLVSSLGSDQEQEDNVEMRLADT